MVAYYHYRHALIVFRLFDSSAGSAGNKIKRGPLTRPALCSDAGIAAFSKVTSLRFRRGGFARARDVFRAGGFEDLLGALDFVAVFRVDGDQDVAALDLAFVTLGFKFRDAHSDERARNAAHRAAEGRAAEGRHDRAGRNERAHAGNRQRANARQPAQRPAEDAAGNAAGRRAFRRLGVLFVREILRARLIGEQHGDVVVGEVRSLQVVHDADGLGFGLCDTEYRGF